MNIIQVCVAFGLYLAFILLCVGDEGRSPRFGDAAEYPFFSTLWTEKRTLNSMTHFLQLTLDYAFLVKSLFLDTAALSESCMICIAQKSLTFV